MTAQPSAPMLALPRRRKRASTGRLSASHLRKLIRCLSLAQKADPGSEGRHCGYAALVVATIKIGCATGCPGGFH
jgi:hypothetical protein